MNSKLISIFVFLILIVGSVYAEEGDYINGVPEEYYNTAPEFALTRFFSIFSFSLTDEFAIGSLTSNIAKCGVKSRDIGRYGWGDYGSCENFMRAGNCNTNTCGKTTSKPSLPSGQCKVHSDCKDNEFCSPSSKKCIAQLDLGGACTYNYNCLKDISNNCLNHVCKPKSEKPTPKNECVIGSVTSCPNKNQEIICKEINGIAKEITQNCKSGSVCDGGKCVVKKTETCSSLNGKVCNQEQGILCSKPTIVASDTNICCLGTCKTESTIPDGDNGGTGDGATQDGTTCSQLNTLLECSRDDNCRWSNGLCENKPKRTMCISAGQACGLENINLNFDDTEIQGTFTCDDSKDTLINDDLIGVCIPLGGGGTGEVKLEEGKPTQISLPYSDWKDSSPKLRLQTACSSKEQCQQYENPEDSEEEFTIKCTSTPAIREQLLQDTKEECSGSNIRKLIVAGGTTACLGVATVATVLTGGVASPSLIVCGLTGATLFSGSYALEIGCEMSKQDLVEGACLATSKTKGDFFTGELFKIGDTSINGIMALIGIVFIIMLFSALKQ